MLFVLRALLLCIVCIVQSCCCKHHLTEVSVGLIFGQSREATSVCILTMFTRVIFWRFVYNSCVVLTFVSIFSSTNSICYCFKPRNFELYVGNTPNVHRIWSVICVLEIREACPTMVVSKWNQICSLCVAKCARCSGALWFWSQLLCLMCLYRACVLVQTLFCAWERKRECFSR